MNVVFIALLLGGLATSLACVGVGLFLLFRRGRGGLTEIRVRFFGTLKTGESGIALIFLGLVLFVISGSAYAQARKADEARTQLDDVKIRTARSLRDEFHAVVDNGKSPLPAAGFGRVNLLIAVLQQMDEENGHALYYAGEVARAEGREIQEQEQFYKYLEVQDTLPKSETWGDSGSEICYTRPEGFCRQRSGWIHHLLANDSYSDGLNEPDAAKKEYLFNKALEEARVSLDDYPTGFGGPGQGVSTKILVGTLTKDVAAVKR